MNKLNTQCHKMEIKQELKIETQGLQNSRLINGETRNKFRSTDK